MDEEKQNNPESTEPQDRMQAVTARINELAKKQREDLLTKEEEKEQEQLRNEFLENFRNNFASQIEMMQVYDQSGTEVTPEKVKDIQREKGLRED